VKIPHHQLVVQHLKVKIHQVELLVTQQVINGFLYQHVVLVQVLLILVIEEDQHVEVVLILVEQVT
jgi:hypothetical protein